MARTRSRTTTDETEFVIALQTFCGDVRGTELESRVGPDITVKEGDRLRADHPAVTRWPAYFVAESADEYERAKLRSAFVGAPGYGGDDGPVTRPGAQPDRLPAGAMRIG